MSKAQKIRAGNIGKVALVLSLFVIVGTVVCVGQLRHSQHADGASMSGIDHLVVTAKRLPTGETIDGIVVTAKRQRYAELAGGAVRSAR